MIDVFVVLLGGLLEEVENFVICLLEKLFWEILGVEYFYFMLSFGGSLIVVCYKVGIDIEVVFVWFN